MASQVLEHPKARAAKQPTAGTVHWFNECVERGKKGAFSEVITITPGLASEMLRYNPDNRNIKPTKAQHFATDMLRGNWAFNGEPIIIRVEGLLNDGQHRLNAIIEANVSIPMIVTFGVPRESRTTVDQGSARSAGDYLSMDGYHYSKNAATAAKFIIAFERSGGRNISQRNEVTNAEVVARVKTDPGITTSAIYAHKHLKDYRQLVSYSVMAACHYLLTDVHAGEAETFLDQVCTGENIKRGDPAFAVRSAFLSEKRERQAAMEVIFHGWNKYRSGQPLQIIRVNGSFPALV
jgi:hypothetical protein